MSGFSARAGVSIYGRGWREVVGQRDIGDRGVRLRAFGDELGLEGF